MTGTYSKSKKFLSVLLLVTFMLTTVVAAPVLAKAGTDIKVQVQQMVTNLSDVASVDVELTSGSYHETVSLTMSGNQAVGHVDEDLAGQDVTVEVTIHWINGTSISITYHTSAANAMLVIQPDGDPISMIEEGSITITKAITGDTPAEDATFTFTVEGYGTYTITGEDSTTIDHVVPGTYTVTEIDLPDNYAISDADMDVTVIDQQIAIAAFTNTYTAPSTDPTTGSLTITKAITGDEPSEDATFSFTISGMEGTFTITGEDSTTIDDLAPGSYTVTEGALPTNYSIADPDQTVAITAGQTASLTFTNTYTAPSVDPTTGSLTITKAITGDEPTVDATFTFFVTATGFEDSYTITGEDSTTIDGLTPGTYTIEEILMPANYSIGDKNMDVTITAGQTATAVFTNTYTAPVTPTYYTVIYDPGDYGTFAQVVYTELEAGDPTPDAPATPGEEDWTFTGWSPARTETVEGDATYVAQWQYNETPVYYTVIYDPGDYGTFEPVVHPSLTYGTSTPHAPESTPGEEGWTFVGWDPMQAISVTENITYYAQWQSNQGPTYYTVTFAPGEHGDFDPVIFSSLPYGVDTPEAPIVEDGYVYLFNGWSPAIADTVTGNITYTAQWKRRSSGGSSYYEDPVPEVIIEETPAPEAPIVVPAPEEVPEEIIIVEEDAPLGELPKTGTGPMCPAPSQAAAYLPEELVLNFKDEDEDDIE